MFTGRAPKQNYTWFIGLKIPESYSFFALFWLFPSAGNLLQNRHFLRISSKEQGLLSIPSRPKNSVNPAVRQPFRECESVSKFFLCFFVAKNSLRSLRSMRWYLENLILRTPRGISSPPRRGYEQLQFRHRICLIISLFHRFWFVLSICRSVYRNKRR